MKKYEVCLRLFFEETSNLFTTVEVSAEDEEMAEIAALQQLFEDIEEIEEVGK